MAFSTESAILNSPKGLIMWASARDFVAVSSFYEYISSGRCETLEGPNGAYNLYENEIRMNTVIEKLNNVIESLEEIKQNQFMIYSAIQENPGQFLAQFSEAQLSELGLNADSTPVEIAQAIANPDNNATLTQVETLNNAMTEAQVEHASTTQTEAKTEAEVKADNIKQASETTVHPSGQSVADMTTSDLDKVGLSDLSTQMQEAYGDKAYMVAHSALAEPTNVVAALKATMPAEDFAKLGFDNSPSSVEVARVLANNPQLAIVGDNKKEPEIVAPESKIYDQTRKAVEDASVNTNNQHFDFTIKLEYPDGKYLIKEINNTQIKDGKISLLV